MRKYIVEKGDTLSKIAEKFNTTVNVLKVLNNIPNVNVIKVGQVINLPTEPNYNEVGEAFKKCLSAIEKLTEFQELKKLL